MEKSKIIFPKLEIEKAERRWYRHEFMVGEYGKRIFSKNVEIRNAFTILNNELKRLHDEFIKQRKERIEAWKRLLMKYLKVSVINSSNDKVECEFCLYPYNISEINDILFSTHCLIDDNYCVGFEDSGMNIMEGKLANKLIIEEITKEEMFSLAMESMKRLQEYRLRRIEENKQPSRVKIISNVLN